MYLVKFLFFILLFGLGPASLSAEEKFNADVRYLHVQKGQTLHNIVRRLYPDRQQEWPKLTSDIVRINPKAFTNGDPASMKAGVRLKLPKKVVITTVPVKPLKRTQVGVVVERVGSVIAVDKRKVSRKLVKGAPVFLSDKVITGEQGFVRLKMIDDAVLDLRCFSIMVIEQYALKSGSRSSILNLLQGSLKKVTGNIGKMADDVYELKTPLASVGVRGTEYALRVFQAKGCGGAIDTDNGLYLKVIKGLVNVQNKAGSQVYAKGETAYVPLPGEPPVKIKPIPGVFQKVAYEPRQPEMKAAPADEDSSSVWWWLLGAVAVILLI